MKKTNRLLAILMLLIVSTGLVFAQGAKEESKDVDLKGKKISMSIAGISGWVPSELSVELADDFIVYAKEKYGYDVDFSFEAAPFSSLFQKIATSLVTQSQEYNILISDSQWLGALAEPGWIVQLNDIIAESESLSQIEWMDPIINKAYMAYPDGTDKYWGLAETGDVLILYVRADWLADRNNKMNFKAKYGWDLPQTFEDFIDVDWVKFEQIAEFFTRPKEGVYGTAIQFSKEYDYMTGSLYPFIWSDGGEIWDEKTGNVQGILDTPENARALLRMVELQRFAPPGCVNYGIPDISAAFTQGKVFSGFQWAAEGASMIPANLADKVLAVPGPGTKQADGTIKRVYSVGGQPWVLNKHNDKEHMEVAIHFMEWWYQKDTQLEFARRGGNPVTAEAINSEGFEDIKPWFKAYKYMLTEENARDFWHEPTYSEMLSYQQDKFTAFAATGGTEADALAVLKDVARAQQKMLYEAGRTNVAPIK